MKRYNRTNFLSPRTVNSILIAMNLVSKSGIPEYIEDRKGQRWLRVVIKMFEGRPTFEFYARNGQEVGDVILQASFDWPVAEMAEFSRLLVKVYTMLKLPAIDNRPKVPAGLVSWRTPSGVTVFGQWRRKWFRKRFYVTHDRNGVQLPQESGYYLDSESMLYGSFQGVTA